MQKAVGFITLFGLLLSVSICANCPIGQVIINNACVNCSTISNTLTSGHVLDNCACRSPFLYDWTTKACKIQCYLIDGATASIGNECLC